MPVEVNSKSLALLWSTRGITLTDIMKTGTMVTMETMVVRLDIAAMEALIESTIITVITCKACQEHIIQVMVSAICVVSSPWTCGVSVLRGPGSHRKWWGCQILKGTAWGTKIPILSMGVASRHVRHHLN